jgi:hypothetical protein
MQTKLAIGAVMLALMAPAHAEPDWTAVGKALGKPRVFVNAPERAPSRGR